MSDGSCRECCAAAFFLPLIQMIRVVDAFDIIINLSLHNGSLRLVQHVSK